MRANGRRGAVAAAVWSLLVAAAIAADDACVLRVKFDAADGSSYRDEVSGERVSAHQVEPVPGVDGMAAGFRFDYKGGVATRVEIPVTPKLAATDPADFTIELWLSPDEIHYAQVLLTEGGPVAVRWRIDHRVWLTVTAADGEQRLVQSRPGAIPLITFPKPTWYHYLATYDGQTGAIYVNGEPVGHRKWPQRKPAARFKSPLSMGGTGWERYTGGVDELAIYSHAFTPAEAKARYDAERKRFEPAPRPAAQTPSTIDGAAYKKRWRRIPLKSGSAEITNTGQLSLVSRNPRWGRPNVIGAFCLSNSDGMKGRYWSNVTGRVGIEYGGRCRVELQGASYRGLGVKQSIEITPEDELRFRYELWPAGPAAPMPVITWPFHLWYSAIPFVGYDKTGQKVRGRMIDLDDTFVFTRELELNFIKGGNRLLIHMPDGWGYELPATREPTRWLGGYSTFYGRFRPLKWEGWTGRDAQHPLVVELTLQLIPDDQPPKLPPDNARVATPERPFDFSALYKPDASKICLLPVGRDAPIFSCDEDVEFRIQLPSPALTQLPTCDYVVRDGYTGAEVTRGKMPVEKRWWEFNATISFKPPKPSVYVVSVNCVSNEGKTIQKIEQEAAVVGPIPQPVARVGQPLKLKLIGEVDCTAEDKTHDFYSRSGKSRVVDTPAGKCRQTLDNKEMAQLGTTDLDWFGYRFELRDPSKTHLVEVVYPDIADLTMGINVFEPGQSLYRGKPEARARVLSGVSTGGVYPVSKRMQRMRTVYFPGAKWCAVTVANIHCGSCKNGPPAAAAAIRVYELAEPLPRLPDDGAGRERLLGIYTESGELGMGAYGYGPVRGERWGGGFGVTKQRFYRDYYRAIENLVRHMRYRGDSVYIYGAYRYRSSRIPTRFFPPSNEVLNGDLLGLMARMFEHNGLKVIPAIQANQPLPVSRLFRCGQYEVVQGKQTSVAQVSRDGRTTTGHFGFMYSNPFHPATHVEWAKLAAEIAQRYADCPAVAGVGWLSGSLWSPALLQMGYRLPKDKVDAYYFGYTYDDETMRKFAKEEKLDLPSAPPDPKRFHKRYEWIMAHARDKWIAFRCRKLAELYKKLAAAMHAQAPGQKFYLICQHPGYLNNAIVAPPLETRRMCGFDPRCYADAKNFVYVACVPDGSGLNIYEHGSMPREWMGQVRPFLDDAEFYAAVETCPRTGRFIHKQFFENRMRYDPRRPWVFGRGQYASEPLKLTHNFYPLPSGRACLEDFALMMARGAPELITWMWCDGSVPMGHEELLREFAAAYRALPMGRYKTVSEAGGVFVRKLQGQWQGADVFYAVNTNRKPAVANVPVTGARAVDLVSGEAVAAKAGAFAVALQAAQMRVLKVERAGP